MEASWATVGVGAALLPPPDGAIMSKDVATRCSAPIPHPFIIPLLQAQQRGALTWHSLWTLVGAPIVADAMLAGVYGPFTDFICISSMQRVAAPAGGAVWDPVTEFALQAPPIDPSGQCGVHACD